MEIAIGMYAPSCIDVQAAVDACIGCLSDPRIRVVAMLDAFVDGDRCIIRPKSQMNCTSTGSTGSSPDACRQDHVERMEAVLPAGVLMLKKTGARINFQKTRALFSLMVQRAPQATWYVKTDTDALLNLVQLRRLLAVEPTRSSDYVGKPVRIFSLRPTQTHFNSSARFVYMQGGLYVLSRRAARSLADCPRGPCTPRPQLATARADATAYCPRSADWTRCPNAFFVDVNNKTVARQQAKFSYSETDCASHSVFNNDDLYTGACMREANMVAAPSSCFFSHPPRLNESA